MNKEYLLVFRSWQQPLTRKQFSRRRLWPMLRRWRCFFCGIRETFDLNSPLEFDLIVMVSDYNSGCWTVYQVKCNHKSKLSIHTAMLLGVMPSIHTTMSQDIAKYSQNVTQGDAEAFAITARASAEAEGMNMKAEAFREYKKAAKVITHSNLPYVMQLIVLLWTKIIKLYSRKKRAKRAHVTYSRLHSGWMLCLQWPPRSRLHCHSATRYTNDMSEKEISFFHFIQ